MWFVTAPSTRWPACFRISTTRKGTIGPRKDGWFKDMLVPGLEGEDLPTKEKWRSLQWLASRTAKDPRFAIAMAEHVWYLLSGRMALRPPQDIENPLFHSSYGVRTKCNDVKSPRWPNASPKENFNLKLSLQGTWPSLLSTGPTVSTQWFTNPHRRAELHDLGVARLLAPEQLERKIEALFGTRWGKVEKEMKILYGGINSQSVTAAPDRAQRRHGRNSTHHGQRRLLSCTSRQTLQP